MGFPPLHLGFGGEGVKQPMEIEGCGFAATLAHPHERGRKRPPSPRTPPGDDDTSSEDDEGDWLVSDSDEEEDHENKGMSKEPRGYLPHYKIYIEFLHSKSWETVEPLRNYVYKREIDNCETVSVKQEMGVARLSLTNPTRVISMPTQVLIEFELHALSDDEKGGDDDDLIIEGCTELDNMFKSKSFIDHRGLYSDKCALDIKYAVLLGAVEARVTIVVCRVPSHVIDLKFYAKTSSFSDIIRLFQGAASEVGFKRSFTVAVETHSSLDLYIKGSPRDDHDHHALGQKSPPQGSWQQSFRSGYHGTVEPLAELGDFAEISVRVTWKTYEKACRPVSRSVIS